MVLNLVIIYMYTSCEEQKFMLCLLSTRCLELQIKILIWQELKHYSVSTYMYPAILFIYLKKNSQGGLSPQVIERN